MFVFALLVVLPALAFSKPANDLSQLVETFLDLQDLNKDGKITVPETETYFMTHDANKDGDITLGEFITSLYAVDLGIGETLYHLFDRNADGKVNNSEIDLLFQSADVNEDGAIEKPEFPLLFSIAIALVG